MNLKQQENTNQTLLAKGVFAATITDEDFFAAPVSNPPHQTATSEQKCDKTRKRKQRPVINKSDLKDELSEPDDMQIEMIKPAKRMK